MTDNYDPSCVLKVDASHVAEVLAAEDGPTPDTDTIYAITAELGERWAARGMYETINEDIRDVAAAVITERAQSAQPTDHETNPASQSTRPAAQKRPK